MSGFFRNSSSMRTLNAGDFPKQSAAVIVDNHHDKPAIRHGEAPALAGRVKLKTAPQGAPAAAHKRRGRFSSSSCKVR